MVLVNEERKRVVLLAIHPLFFETTKPIAAKLMGENLEVVHPPTISDFVGLCNTSSAHDIIVTLYFTENKTFRDRLEVLEQRGITMIDSFSQMRLTEDRMNTFKLLRVSGVKTPQYFFGPAGEMPFALGDKLVCKDPYGHEVALVSRKNLLHPGKKNVYVEERIPNDESIVRCVMYVFGKIYTRIKQDKFSDNEVLISGTEPITQPTRSEVDLVQTVHRITNMNLFNIDVIRDTVIEINCCPNFFSYKLAIGRFVEQLKSIANKEISTR